jgi:iron-sulfur cluster repair protein YtfE (RIC family)
MRPLLQAFSRDHSHLLALAAAARRELAGPPAPGSPCFAALALRLRRHLRFEEDLLFPAIERLVGDPDFHLTATLRREHQLLRRLLGDVEEALVLHNHAGALGNLFELEAAMRTHEGKEQRVLYPMADRVTVASERAMVAELEAPVH